MVWVCFEVVDERRLGCKAGWKVAHKADLNTRPAVDSKLGRKACLEQRFSGKLWHRSTSREVFACLTEACKVELRSHLWVDSP